jgi:hypothetical protein
VLRQKEKGVKKEAKINFNLREIGNAERKKSQTAKTTTK